MSESSVSSQSWSRWIFFGLLAWTVLAAIPTSSAYIAEGSNGLARWLSIFGKIAPYYYMWALVTPLIYRLSVSTLNPARGWGITLLGHTVMALILSAGFGFVLHYNNWQEWLIGTSAAGHYAMSAFSYIFILLGIHLYKLQAKVRSQEARLAEEKKRALELETSLARSQVERLRGQMNPHFLFNALNCIGALIETGQNERAYQALEDMGGLLRTSLEHRDHDLVPLEEELSFIQRYIAMEQVRFGERLQLRLAVDSAARKWPVPPFLLQPLIENVVRHALVPSHETVTINLSASRIADGIGITVADDGCGSNASNASDGTGVGLENLHKRLELTYGQSQLLAFTQDQAGTRVVLKIPERRQTEATDIEESGRQQAISVRLQTQQ